LAEAKSGLSVEGLVVRYGRTEILRGASFRVRAGEVVCLLGANGSGKSTALNTLTGFVAAAGGSIRLNGADLTAAPQHVKFRRGIVLVSQRRDLFPEMTVEENLRLGAAFRRPADFAGALERIFATFPRLAERRRQRSATMSGGEQQMVAIGRALMSNPEVLLLDEPSGGLAPRFVDEIRDTLIRLKTAGTTMMLVEQNLGLATEVADRFYILRDGVVGEDDAIRNERITEDELVRRIFL
jgi:branched-chain amino acid transport system ATP-binding protein